MRRDLPGGVDARGFGLVESGVIVSLVEPDDQGADAEGADASALRVSLLNTRNVFGDVLDRDWVLDRQPVTLCLQSRLVDQYSCIGIKTRESEADVCIDEPNLGRCDPCILQLHGGPLLAPQDDDVCAFDADGAGAALDGFEGILDLEDVAVGTAELILRVSEQVDPRRVCRLAT